MDEQLVRTAARMRRCAAIVEEELKAVITLTEKMRKGFSDDVAEVLVRYVEDAANLPLRVARRVPSAADMRAAVDALADVLRDVEPWHLREKLHLRRAAERTAAVVRRRALPPKCAAEYQRFVARTAAAFRSLEELARSDAAGKQRSPGRLLHALRRFARGSWYAVVCLSFNALKLAVCARLLVDDGAANRMPMKRHRRVIGHLDRLREDHPRVAAALPDLFEAGLAATRRLLEEEKPDDDDDDDDERPRRLDDRSPARRGTEGRGRTLVHFEAPSPWSRADDDKEDAVFGTAYDDDDDGSSYSEDEEDSRAREQTRHFDDRRSPRRNFSDDRRRPDVDRSSRTVDYAAPRQKKRAPFDV